MDCKSIEAWICDILDGSLAERDARMVNDHLATCAACRYRIQENRRLSDLLGSVPSMSPPPYFERLVMRGIERRYRRSWRETLQSFYEDMVHPLRMLDRRDLLIGLVSLPIALGLFLAIFCHIQLSIFNSQQVGLLTFVSDKPLVAIPSGEARSEEGNDAVTPVGISSPALIRFVESAAKTEAKGDDLLVMVYVNQYGTGSIEQVIEYPNDHSILNKLNTLIASAKFRPARRNGKRVDSYFLLALNQVHVLG
ncbi:MAG: zf-HC2 domain-containing protein [Acidobacteria bacterium]|nr:zf-HC2 domain-containing protein [Acidobacteriota bacterium]